MSYWPNCDLYCYPSRPAEYYQDGWWPETFACGPCRQHWDYLCSRHPGCVANRNWQEVTQHLVDELVADTADQQS